MQEFNVSKNNNGKKLVRVLSLQYPNVPVHVFQKALKVKDILVDGQRVNKDVVVNAGSVIRHYIKDEVLSAGEAIFQQSLPDYTVVFETKQLLIVSKPQGMTVHPGRDSKPESTLIEKLRSDFANPNLSLCHRLDRNTGGLVLVAKNKNVQAKLTEAIANQQIIMRYRCLVRGIPEAGSDILLSNGDAMHEVKAFWEKPVNSDIAYIHAEAKARDLPIITRYRVLQIYTNTAIKNEAVSELEVEIMTGRPHQIRAHLAFLGHPILGDGKYGRNEYNLQFTDKAGKKLAYQQLFATTMMFSNDLPLSLADMRRRTFNIQPDFALTFS